MSCIVPYMSDLFIYTNITHYYVPISQGVEKDSTLSTNDAPEGII